MDIKIQGIKQVIGEVDCAPVIEGTIEDVVNNFEKFKEQSAVIIDVLLMGDFKKANKIYRVYWVDQIWTMEVADYLEKYSKETIIKKHFLEKRIVNQFLGYELKGEEQKN